MMQHDENVHPLVNMGKWQVRDVAVGETKETSKRVRTIQIIAAARVRRQKDT